MLAGHMQHRANLQWFGRSREAPVWLERAYEKRDQKMVFLKVEPKWNNLRDESALPGFHASRRF
jgi:hypothetical protein